MHPQVTPRVDRVTEDSYDLANRKMERDAPARSRTAMNADGTSNWSDLDHHLRLRRRRQPAPHGRRLGATTYSYYDALGRVTAVVAPTQHDRRHEPIPLTTFRRDAYGNVVVKVDHAVSAVSASDFVGNSSMATPGYVAGANSSADRATVSTFDLDGHATETTVRQRHQRLFGNANQFFLVQRARPARQVVGKASSTTRDDDLVVVALRGIPVRQARPPDRLVRPGPDRIAQPHRYRPLLRRLRRRHQQGSERR